LEPLICITYVVDGLYTMIVGNEVVPRVIFSLANVFPSKYKSDYERHESMEGKRLVG